MEVMTLVWFAGGFFGQLSIVIIRLRAILMLATQLLSCVQLPPGEAMFQLLKRNSAKSFSRRRNGGANLEETEEDETKGSSADKLEDIHEEETLDASVLEAKAAVKFNTANFLKDLIYHIFFPLTVPLMMWLDGGWYSLVNRGFLPGDHMGIVIAQAALACCCVCVLATKSLCKVEDGEEKFVHTQGLDQVPEVYLFNGVSLVYVGQEHQLDFLYDIALVDILWIMRNVVVATKYAFTSKVAMEKMRTQCMDSSDQYYRTLLGGWADPIPRKVLKQELLLAAVRCRKVLIPYSFKLNTSVDSFEALQDMVSDLQLNKDDCHKKGNSWKFVEKANRWLETAGGKCLNPMAWTKEGARIRPGSLPTHLYAAHVIHQSSSLSRLRRVGHTLLSQHLKKCGMFVSLVMTVLPFVLRVLLGGHTIPGPKWADWVIGCSAFIILFFSMYSSIVFMMVGILDLRRRHYVDSKLNELLITGVYTGSNFIRTTQSLRSKSLEWLRSLRSRSRDSASSVGSSGQSSLSGHGISIDLFDLQSIQAWMICRIVIHDFGLGFYKRIKYYTTYFACYCGVLIVFMGLRLIKGIKKQDIYILASVLLCLDVFLTLLALMVWPGGDINVMRQIQGATLTHTKLRLQLKLEREKHDVSSEEANKYYNAMQTMSSISEAVKWDNRKHKISVCGFQAGEQLLGLIVAIVTASISIGVGQIVANVVSRH